MIGICRKELLCNRASAVLELLAKDVDVDLDGDVFPIAGVDVTVENNLDRE